MLATAYPSFTRRHLAVTLIGVWACLVTSAFWWYYIRPQGPFATATLSPAEWRALPAPTGVGIRVALFVDPGCTCTLRSRAHIGALIRQFAPQGVHFLHASRSAEPLPEWLSRHSSPAPDLHAWWSPLESSPAIAIWDARGELAYVGPLGTGIACRSDGMSESVLTALLAGYNPHTLNTIGQGCFCPTHV